MEQTMAQSRRQAGPRSSEAGSILVLLIGLAVPLLIMLTAAAGTMVGRSKTLQEDIKLEKALMAAESGIDEALYRANLGILVPGELITRELADGMGFEVTTVSLKTDGVDNDADGLTDEADESVIMVTATGTYAGTSRRVNAYLGQLPQATPFGGAANLSESNLQIEIEGSSLVTGLDTNLDGTPGPGPAVPGMSVSPPGTIPDLLGSLSATERPKVTGLGPAPSLGLGSVIDLASLARIIKSSATQVLTSAEYEGATIGNALTNNYVIAYASSNLTLKAGTRGAGILLVEGNLHMADARWDGLIVALGSDIEMEAGSSIYGKIVQGPTGQSNFHLRGSWIYHSSQAMDGAFSAIPGKYVSFDGWHEVSKD
ncbi:MAG: hypothetical protein R3F30_16480 [Planctomycetota bacterium]